MRATGADHLGTVFRSWSAAREVALHRTAFLLTGDPATARLQAREALAAALATEPGDPADLDAAALRALLAGGTTRQPGLVLSDSADVERDACHRLVWDYLSTLGRVERGALVLRFHAGLDAGASAALLGLAASDVDSRTDTCLDDLAGLLHLTRPDTEAVVRVTLETCADRIRVVPLTYSQVMAVARGRRARRLRTTAILAAGAGAAVLVPVLALSGRALPPPPAPAPEGPGSLSGIAPGDRLPPPWVLPPGSRSLRVGLETRCSSTTDEEFRSITMIQAGCRTRVLKNR